MSGKILAPDEGEVVSGVGGSVRFLLERGETNGTLGALVQTVSPGSGPPLHHHDGYDEVLLVLRGEVEATLGNTVERLGAEGFVYIPRGTPHRFVNVGSVDASLLVLVSPGGFERYFRERVQLDPMRDLEALTEVADRFGMIVKATHETQT